MPIFRSSDSRSEEQSFQKEVSRFLRYKRGAFRRLLLALMIRHRVMTVMWRCLACLTDIKIGFDLAKNMG